MNILFRCLRYALYLGLAGIVAGSMAVAVAYWLIAPRLPSVETLKDVRMQVPLRVYSADGKLIATFGETRRIPVRIADVPVRLKDAFLAAEDSNFYDHPGVDWQGFVRAVGLMVAKGSLHVPGGSTITQQVARNFFLSSEVSVTRKISEIFLSLRIENALSKDEILELYLNKIFLGHRSYGVAAAAELYYGKTLDQLTFAECAMLASLPKFPSTGNPIYNRPRATERRNYVLGRMLSNRFIDKLTYEQARQETDLSYVHEPPIELEAPYVAELVRQDVVGRLGNDAMNDGYVAHITLDSTRQQAANQGVRDALLDYDQRHGYRGAEAHVDLSVDATPEEWSTQLAGYRTVSGLTPGLVTHSGKDSGQVYLSDGQSVALDLDAVRWARPYLDDSRRGAAPKQVQDVLKTGDIVRLMRDAEGQWTLTQLPAVQGALVALDPEDGAIQAMVGGFNFQRSKFNRATQSARQPGSSFKPFLYSAAFDHGFTPASLVNDAPIALPDPSRPDGVWAPKNDNDSFAGPTRLREALVRSVNLVSIRLLDAIGVRYAHEYMGRFGFSPEQIPNNLSMALGTAAVSPLSMARGYAVFANGGYLVDPYLITRIDDRDGHVVYQVNPARACGECPGRESAEANLPSSAAPATNSRVSLNPIGDAQATAITADPTGQDAPHLAPRVIDARTAYLVTSLMRDVVRRGTGRGAMVLERNDLAAKTGSTNDHRDAWFAGFNGKLAVSSWVGFDDFRSLGRGEFGAKAALPMWVSFMRVALHDMPETSLDMPAGITTARIDPESGYLAPSGAGIVEYFKVEDVARLAAQPNQPSTDPNEQREAYDVF